MASRKNQNRVSPSLAGAGNRMSELDDYLSLDRIFFWLATMVLSVP